MAICDSYYRFTWVDIGDYGSSSDASTFKHTALYNALERNSANIPEKCKLPRSNVTLPYFFIGDAIFPLKPYLLKPFSKNEILGEREKVFNYRVSRARNCIEDAFGILSEKWQILQKSMNLKIDTSVAVVQAIVCLHNFIITDELPLKECERQYCVPKNRNANCNTDFNMEEEEIVYDVAYDVRQQLASYFFSPEGQIH